MYGTESRTKTVVVKNRRLVAKLQADFSLGRGEAEAIALALNEKAEVLGIDDKSGINACKLLGIAFTTAVGILIRSREKGLLTPLRGFRLWPNSGATGIPLSRTRDYNWRQAHEQDDERSHGSRELRFPS